MTYDRETRHANDATASNLRRISATNRPDARAFIDLKRGQGLRANTICNIANALRVYDAHLAARSWRDTRPADITALLASLRLAGRADSYLEQLSTWVKQLLRWAWDEHALPYRLQQAFRLHVRHDLPPRPIVDRSMLARLRAAAPSLRDEALLCLLIATGLRRQAAVELNVSSLRFTDDGLAEVTIPGRPRAGLKTGPRSVWIAQHVELLRSYSVTHPTPDQDDSALFPRCNARNQLDLLAGTRLSGWGVWNVLSRLADAAGVPHFRVHDTRHTNATLLHESGASPIDMTTRVG